MLKIKFDRLDYQEKAVGSISGVFENVLFTPNENRKSNPWFDVQAHRSILEKNIHAIREKNGVSIGDVDVKDELNIDTLMETGTGKTFTFLETIYKLNHDYGLCKFIILVPSNPIRQGTLKNIAMTKEFFLKEYGKHISTFNYNEKTILNYINASDQNISVLVSTYQSFNKAKNTINKRSIEKSLIGRAKSYMEAVAELHPVVIIDEPHRFEGKQTAEYLAKFKPLFTLRFGATFKDDVYKNLVYTLDSVDAFSRGLVKAITVDTVGNEHVGNHTIALKKVSGSTQKEYEAHIEYKDIDAKTKSITLRHGDNVGEKTGIAYLSGYVIEKITKTEVVFTNEIALPLGQNESYGLLLDEMQRIIVDTAIKNHFEREEELFKLRIKSLCLFFIDGVDTYKKDDGSDGKLARLFEKLYAKNLEEVLSKELDEGYRAYLMRTQKRIRALHDGYFAKSKNLKDEEDAIELILNKKEELLSFETDLRFIFSQWALQEGWDNPNVMTLAKLAPSNSKISKLQQIGRGLRLAVDQEGQRITKEHERFDFVNELFVVVPSTEENFVTSIQNEISEHSIKHVSRVFNAEIMMQNKIATNAFTAVTLLSKLQENEFIELDDEGNGEIVISKEAYNARFCELESLHVKGCDNAKLKEYFDSFFKTASRVKQKEGANKTKGKIKIHPANFKKFQNLWNTLNHDAVVKYDINSAELIKNAALKIDNAFAISTQDIIIKRDKNIENKDKHDSQTQSVEVKTHAIFTLYEFIKALSNKTKLSFQTLSYVLGRIKKETFERIAKNENVALQKLEEQLISAIYDIIINKISYDIKEIKTKNTSFTDKKGNLKAYLDEGSLGRETHKITKKSIKDKSIYDEDFMEIDSEIEGVTIEESDDTRVVVFGKLPRVNIPTVHGRSYNPDFGYVIEEDGAKELYFIVETKGVHGESELRPREKLQIESAKAFFKALQEKGINVRYETKLNSPTLSQMISDILKTK